MKIVKTVRALFLFILAIATSSFAVAQGGYPGRPPGGGGPDSYMGGGMRGGSRIAPPGTWWKNPDLVTKLSITTDQQKRMDDILQQSRIQLVHIKATLEEQQILLEPMLNANPPDSAKTLTQISTIADTRASLEKANAKMLLGIRGVLTADQWTKLQAEMHTRRSSRDSRDSRGSRDFDRRGGPGGPGGPRGPRPGGGGPSSQPTPPATPPAE
jgi:Spy/CpxP family protein refolding chaperone